MLIKSRNLLHQTASKTRFSFGEASGTNVIRWQNPAGLTASWALQLGETGEEQTEVVVLGTAAVATGTAGTLTANTLYEHPADTPVYGIKYDKVVFERSTSGTTGTATPITNGTITYQADSLYTIFDDTSGSASYAYRTYFKNSAGAAGSTTIESDWITSSGFSFYSLAAMRERAKQKLWASDYLTDPTIDNWINEWKDEMANGVISVNEDYSLGTENVAFGTDGLGTVTTADFSQVRRVWITYNGVDRFQSTKMNVNDYFPARIFSSAHPYHNWHGDTIFEVKPSESGGTAELIFYRFGTTMVNDTDILPQPMRSYTKSFVDYVEANALKKDQKPEWKEIMGIANAAKQDFILNLVPRDKTGPTFIDITEPVSGDDAYIP